MVLAVALIAIALAANPENRVLGLVSYACSIQECAATVRAVAREGWARSLAPGLRKIVRTTEIYTLSLHDALPICERCQPGGRAR